MQDSSLPFAGVNLQQVSYLLHLARQARIAVELALNLFNGIHYGGMILAAKGLTNTGQGEICSLPHQEHPHLAGLADGPFTARAQHLLNADGKNF
jgi:hypothetical protein